MAEKNKVPRIQAWQAHTQSQPEVGEKLAALRDGWVNKDPETALLPPEVPPSLLARFVNALTDILEILKSHGGERGFLPHCPPSPLRSVGCHSVMLMLSCHFGLVSHIMVINANSQHELWAAQMLEIPRAGREPSFYIS